MSKAILVMDMPSSCFKCPVGRNESIPLETAIVCMEKNKWLTGNQCESKPEWCPVKPMPEKKENAIGTNYQRFVNGYNACIDEIMKGSEEDE